MKGSLLNLEELGYEKFDTSKPIRLIELFGGYGSQAFALKYLGANFEHWKLCEWAVKSIQAYKDAHCKEDITDYSKELTKEQIFEYLYQKGISANYNEPMSYEQVKRLGEEKARIIYNNIQATHNLVNIQQVKGADLMINNTDKYNYIITYSYPCQDMSLAGKGAGMTKGSGTRSGMLWEFERILDEIKSENKELPQVLIMENVPQVHGSKNIQDFEQWIKKLESLGYSNYYKDLNGKNFGIPQNRERCFMVSLLGNYKYEFPREISLEYRLKNLLENEVDEKYYLSDKALQGLQTTTFAQHKLENRTEKDGVAPTLCARDYKDPHLVKEEIQQVAQMYPNSGNPQAGRIYDKDGLSPCLDTCQGGNREVKIVDENCSKLQKEVCNKAVNYMQPGDTIDYTYSNSRLEEMEHGFIKTKNSEDNTIMNTLTTNAEAFGVCVEEPRICASRGRILEKEPLEETMGHYEQILELGPKDTSNTLTTSQKDNYLVEPQGNLKRQMCNQLIEENKVRENDVIRHSYSSSRMAGEMKDIQQNNLSPTLDTRCDCLGVCVKDEPKVIGGIGKKKSNGGSQWYQQDRIYDDKVAITISTGANPFYKSNLRIRKLTPKECFRLMAVKDKDYENIAENQSNASLYHLAGDSIIVCCLMAIFGKLLNIDWEKHYNPKEWWNI